MDPLGEGTFKSGCFPQSNRIESRVSNDGDEVAKFWSFQDKHQWTPSRRAMEKTIVAYADACHAEGPDSDLAEMMFANSTGELRERLTHIRRLLRVTTAFPGEEQDVHLTLEQMEELL